MTMMNEPCTNLETATFKIVLDKDRKQVIFNGMDVSKLVNRVELACTAGETACVVLFIPSERVELEGEAFLRSSLCPPPRTENIGGMIRKPSVALAEGLELDQLMGKLRNAQSGESK